MGKLAKWVAVGILLGLVSGCAWSDGRTEGGSSAPRTEGTSDEVARFEVQNFAPC